MTGKISQCTSCGNIFDSKTRLKEHIDKTHRITDSKILIHYNNYPFDAS